MENRQEEGLAEKRDAENNKTPLSHLSLPVLMKEAAVAFELITDESRRRRKE
jgi:hypothetical protein